MGSKYILYAKNYDSKAWDYSAQSRYFIIIIFKLIYSLVKYQCVDFNIRGDKKK